MTHNGPTEERFLKDVANHKLRVVHDDGLHRHLVLSAGSFNQRFTITTAPDTLLFTGDMGTFVFERLEDMFEFFRARVNPDYWAGKCVAADQRTGGLSHFNRADFDVKVGEHLDGFIEEHRYTTREAARLRAEVKDALAAQDDDDWRGLTEAMSDFEFFDDADRRYAGVFGTTSATTSDRASRGTITLSGAAGRFIGRSSSTTR